MSWSPEVRTGSDPKFYGNALRFATKEEAEANVRDLMMRWFAVVETRVVETEDPVNYRWVDSRLEGIVAIVDEEHDGGPKVVARTTTLREAENWIAEREKSEPEKVHRGGYGIDAPEEVVA